MASLTHGTCRHATAGTGGTADFSRDTSRKSSGSIAGRYVSWIKDLRERGARDLLYIPESQWSLEEGEDRTRYLFDEVRDKVKRFDAAATNYRKVRRECEMFPKHKRTMPFNGARSCFEGAQSAYCCRV